MLVSSPPTLLITNLYNTQKKHPGTRGATSAEYFLSAGYAVVFMHRQFSLQPFSRHYSHSTHPFMDFLEIDPPAEQVLSAEATLSSPPHIAVTPSEHQNLLQVLGTYKSVQAKGTLHTLTFVTVNDYLWLLRAVSQELSVLGRSAMYYLAAAVSDFFLPRQKMVSCIYFYIVIASLTLIVTSPNIRSNQEKAVFI